MPHYRTIEDYTSDDSFQQWILFNDSEARVFWEEFRRQHPDQEDTVQQAAHLLRSLRFAEQHPSALQEAKVWQRIQQDVAARGDVPKSGTRRYLYRPWGVAASLVLLLSFVGWWGWQRWSSDFTAVRTDYGEIREVCLPDSSRVTLNGNSRLRFASDWSERENREVWLEGEAYFEVRREKVAQHPAKFTVHTHQLNVEVLGTAFDVSDREERAYVVLTEGSVALNIGNEAAVLQMKPGERFAIQGDFRIHETSPDNVSQWSSWKEKELIFHHQSLREIAIRLNNAYGYRLEFPSETVAAEKFTTSIQSQDIELLFSLIARSFDLDYTVQGRVVTFQAN